MEALLAGASSGVVSFLAEAVVVERIPDQRWSAVILGNLRLRVEIGDYTLWILGGRSCSRILLGICDLYVRLRAGNLQAIPEPQDKSRSADTGSKERVEVASIWANDAFGNNSINIGLGVDYIAFLLKTLEFGFECV